MPRGKANVQFTGGFLDGQTSEQVESRALFEELYQATGSWYRQPEPGDKVEIIEGGNLDENWIGYLVHKYKKCGKNDSGYIMYTFVKELLVERCTAITKSGKQCSKTKFKNLEYCETHKNKK